MPKGGWHNAKSDEEKRITGSYRPSNSEAARARKLAENVFAGPGFTDVPDPTLPLSPFEQRQYFEVCGRVLAQGRLTDSTRKIAEQMALLYGQQHQRLTCNERVPAYITRDLMRLTASLKLVEDTQPIGGNVGTSKKENPFGVIGALIRPFAPGRLQGASTLQA